MEEEDMDRHTYITPYLHAAGVDNIDFEHINKTSDFSQQTRIAEGIVFNNGMMLEIKKNLKFDGTLFFEFIKCLVSETNAKEILETGKTSFKSKMHKI